MKPKKIYLGRINQCCELGTSKEKWDSLHGFDSGYYLHIFCSKGFEKFTGIKLKPGECREVKITIKLV